MPGYTCVAMQDFSVGGGAAWHAREPWHARYDRHAEGDSDLVWCNRRFGAINEVAKSTCQL